MAIPGVAGRELRDESCGLRQGNLGWGCGILG
jgi:hypothetical protein